MWENQNKDYNKLHQTIRKDCCDTPKPDCHFDVKHNRYKDVISTAKYIYKNEGIFAFTKGILPRLSINVPATALSWGTYELVKSLLIDQKSD